MSKFDEILNSSDASDALLGEQIDQCVKKGEIEKEDIDSTLIINKCGNVVVMNGYLNNVTFNGGTITIATIKNKPDGMIRTICNCGANAFSVGVNGYFCVYPNGEIKVTTSYSGSGSLYVSCSYVVAE